MPGMLTAKELREKRARLATEAQDIVKNAPAEGLTAEDRQRFDGLMGEVDTLKGDIDRIERLEAEARDLAAPQATIAGQKDTATVTVEERKAQHEAAFRAYVMGGEQNLSNEQRNVLREARAQSVGTDSEGGYLVPEGFSNALERSMLAFGGMRQAATVFSTNSGNVLPWPTVNDTGNVGAILAENTQVSEQDVAFSVINFQAYKYSSKLVRVSVELLQDSAFSMDGVLAPMLGERIARITNTHFTTGDNSSKPQGAIAGASSGVTATGTTAVTYEELLDLLHSVDPAYRTGPKVGWMFKDATLKALRKLEDGDGRPLWQAGLTNREPDTLFGYQYWINQDCATMAASATPIAFGDFSKYRIRDVAGVTLLRLTERYADYHQIGFLAFSRHDGRILDAGTDPIKKLTMAAS